VIHSDGIDAMLATDDAAGNYPHLGFAHGSRILVRPEDEARARELIDSVETA